MGGAVTLVAAVAAAVVSIITALRVLAQIATVKDDVAAVHQVVNSQRTAMMDEIVGLKRSIAERDKADQASWCHASPLQRGAKVLGG